MPRRLAIRPLIVLALLLVLAVPPSSLTPVFAAACGTSLNLGIPLQCSLNSVGNTHRYTLTSPAGDIILRAARLNGALQPTIRVLDADENQLCFASSSGTMAEIPRCTLPTAGSYTVELSDRHDSRIGQYVLHAQHLSAPVQPAPLELGKMTLDSLALGGTMMIYQITGTADDVWVLRAGVTSSTLDPHLRLYAPDGSEVCGAASTDYVVETNPCLLPADGTYTVLMTHRNDVGTGSYSLTVQSLREPALAEELAIGVRAGGTIATSGAMKTFTVAGKSGDVLVLHVGTDRSSLSPRIDLYDPAGSHVCGAASHDPAKTSLPCPLPRDGTYTVLMRDIHDAGTGSFGLGVQRLATPAETTELTFGTPAQGSIALHGELDSYAFSGNSGDVPALRLAVQHNGFEPAIGLYSDQGIQVCAVATYNQVADIRSCILPTDGRYLALVYDFAKAGTDSYALTIQRVTEPENARVIAFDQLRNDSVSKPGELASYQLSGYANAPITLRMTDADREIHPQVRLYGPDGTLLCGAETYNPMAETRSCILPTDGDYTIIASEWTSAATGTYELEVRCEQDDACGPDVTVDPEEPGDPDEPETPEEPGDTQTFVYLPVIVRR
jgi:hypothetical protein